MNWLWLSGWAIEPDWFAHQASAAFPGAAHTAVSPLYATDAIATRNFDALGGFSLGALWLIYNTGIIPPERPVILLAPIFAFPSESGLGGRIPLAQLQLQRRRTRNDAASALSEFSLFTGIPADAFYKNSTIWNSTALDTGLAWLTEWRVTAPPPAHWKGFVGGKDTLLDASRLKQLWPEITIVDNASHDPRLLLHSAALQLKSSHLFK